ncbi:hypothetical protein LOK74_20175 [Brevibacillus humidisoli]|uniref:hypothetical protein n=1 Tax=Brevibacillus humidisoli TaxID=2895522 RepID=UPI001E4AFE1E|nr:hypothetical protein [Brevibacillus humidisoli]UFJ40324.1 hypothetical protein LOK74_20175 [Brevibacillus humidisoli]
MGYSIITCQNDAEYEQFARFFLENREDFFRPYSLRVALQLIEKSVEQGNILLGFNDRGEVIGTLVYTIGTREADYLDEHVVDISLLLLRKDYRKSKLFLHGFRRVADAIGEAGAEEVRFHATADSPYLRKLYSKFASVVSQKRADTCIEDIYSVKYSDFVHFCNRLLARQGLQDGTEATD